MAGSGRMRRTAGRLGAAVMGAWLVACLPQARAAQPTLPNLALDAAYGDGVHAYFAGDYIRAYDDLSQVIEAGTRDPRAYYFRGLAALRQGRDDEAEADFTTGAERESESLGNWPVSRSLERVQGADRLRLERHRVRARVVLLQRQREAERLRYSQIEEAQPEVLRRRRPVTPRLEEEEGNVFEEQDGGGGEPQPEPAADEEAEAMPAGDDGPVGEEPAEEDDAFGGAAAAEQTEDLAAEREDVEAQREEQAEMSEAEAEDEGEAEDDTFK